MCVCADLGEVTTVHEELRPITAPVHGSPLSSSAAAAAAASSGSPRVLSTARSGASLTTAGSGAATAVSGGYRTAASFLSTGSKERAAQAVAAARQVLSSVRPQTVCVCSVCCVSLAFPVSHNILDCCGRCSPCDYSSVIVCAPCTPVLSDRVQRLHDRNRRR